jgi:hypothetical protein
MKIIRKLSIKLILFQILALHLFGNAFFHFYYFLNADFYECIMRSNPESIRSCWEPYKDQTLGSLISQPFHFMFYGLCFGVLLIILINLIKKKSLWNVVLITILYIFLMYIRAFSDKYLDSWIYSFGRTFSDKIWLSDLIASLTSLVIGLLLILLSLKNNFSKKEKVI